MNLVFLVSATLIYNSLSQVPPGDLNDKWRLNDILIQHIDGFYNEFAITLKDASDMKKRFSSIVSLAMSIYASSDITDPGERVYDAVYQTRSMLNQTADSISSLMRSRLSLMQSILDPPINDVKSSCPPHAYQDDCITTLREYRKERERACRGYSKHVDLYNAIVDPKTSGYRTDFMNALHTAHATGDDEQAIQFFIDISTIRYPELFKYINRIYKSLVNERFPCNAFSSSYIFW